MYRHSSFRKWGTVVTLVLLVGPYLAPSYAGNNGAAPQGSVTPNRTGVVVSTPPRITTITVHPTTDAHQQVLEFDIQADPDRPFISGSVPLALTAFNANHKVNSNASVNQARVMPIMLTEERIGFAAQGSDSRQALIFGNWQYIDKLVSWGGTSERNVTAPAQAWIDAAHRNGVKIYGNIFLAPVEYGGHQNHLDYLIQQDGRRHFVVADKLIELAETQGFDGWFLNQEIPTNVYTAAKVAEFMDYVQANSDIELIWYDSMTEDGLVGWQEELNSQNDRFFHHDGKLVSEAMFLDFIASPQELADSKLAAHKLGRSEFDLYAGAILESGGIAQGSSAMNHFLTSGAGGSHHSSVSMFRPDNEYFDDYAENGFDFQALIESEAMSYVGASGDPSRTSKLVPGTDWNGFAHHIAAKTPLTRDRFVSNFNYGIGSDYYMTGTKVTSRDWNNIGAQDVLPTWRWFVETDGKSPIKVRFNFEDAYIGGSCMSVWGSVSQQVDLPLFLTEVPVYEDSKLVLVYKAGHSNQSVMKAYITLLGDEANRITLDLEECPEANWNEAQVKLGEFSGRTISSIGLQFLPAADEELDIGIGQLGVIRGERDILAPATNLRLQSTPIQITPDQYDLRLLWDHSVDYSSSLANNNLYYYNVFQQLEDRTRQLLGVTGGEGYWINDLLRENGAESATLIVEAVSLEFGIRPAVAKLDWDTLRLTVLPTLQKSQRLNTEALE